MDNTSSNATEPPAAAQSVGGLLAYYIVFIVVVVLPVVAVNVLILLALLLDRSTTSVIKVVLCNIPIACMVVAAGILLYDFAGIVLVFTEVGVPTNNHGICRAVLFLVGSGGAARLLFLAAFSVTVYAIIRCNIANLLKSRRYILWYFVGGVAVLWFIAILGTFSVTLDTVITAECRFAKVGALVQLCIFAVVFGVGVFLLTTVFLILTVCYLRKNTITDGDAHFKEAMLKLTFFLLIGNVVNFIGQILPPLVAIAVITSDFSSSVTLIVANVSYVILDLSLVPSPILLIIYFKPMRLRLKSWLCFCCKSRKKATVQGKVSTQEIKLTSD